MYLECYGFFYIVMNGVYVYFSMRIYKRFDWLKIELENNDVRLVLYRKFIGELI